MVTRDVNPSAGLQVFHTEVIILDIVVRTFEFGENAILTLQFMGENDFASMDFRAILESTRGHGSEYKFDGNVRTHHLVIDDKEIVVILRGIDRLFARILQGVRNEKRWFPLH